MSTDGEFAGRARRATRGHRGGGWKRLPRALAGAAALALVAGACQPASPPGEAAPGEAAAVAETPEGAFARAIEEAHGLAAWRSQPAFAAEIQLEFGGQQVFAGTMLFPTDLAASRLDLNGGALEVVYDGEDVWVLPADAEIPPGGRFHALTWPYFLAVPMKLRDPGTRLELTGDKPLQGEPHATARLTFAAGTGDTPEDWYLLYRDPATDRLAAMAYIVTYGTSLSEAEQDPHGIAYAGFVDVDGVAIPTDWTFWPWSEEEGLSGEALGRMTLTNPRFVAPDLGAFDRVEGGREEPLPAPR